MRPVHPGRILRREVQARNLSANALALALRTPSGRVTDILNGKRGVSPETAIRFGRYFGNSARFWLNLQTSYELRSPRRNSEKGSRLRWRRRSLDRPWVSGRLRRNRKSPLCSTSVRRSRPHPTTR